MNNLKITSSIVAIVVCVTAIVSCDQDPFRTSYRRVAGDYYLHRWEDGKTYYLEDKTRPKTGGGVLDGVVEDIAWSENIILAKRRSTFGGDPDGWMVVNVKDKTIKGPVGDYFSNISEAQGMTFMSAEKAWTTLR